VIYLGRWRSCQRMLCAPVEVNGAEPVEGSWRDSRRRAQFFEEKSAMSERLKVPGGDNVAIARFGTYVAPWPGAP
jgi:hypothetical protein